MLVADAVQPQAVSTHVRAVDRAAGVAVETQARVQAVHRGQSGPHTHPATISQITNKHTCKHPRSRHAPSPKPNFDEKTQWRGAHPCRFNCKTWYVTREFVAWPSATSSRFFVPGFTVKLDTHSPSVSCAPLRSAAQPLACGRRADLRARFGASRARGNY